MLAHICRTSCFQLLFFRDLIVKVVCQRIKKKSVIIAFRFVIRAAFLCTSEGGGERKKDRGKRSPLSGIVCSHLWLVCNGRVGDVAATKNILFSLS